MTTPLGKRKTSDDFEGTKKKRTHELEQPSEKQLSSEVAENENNEVLKGESSSDSKEVEESNEVPINTGISNKNTVEEHAEVVSSNDPENGSGDISETVSEAESDSESEDSQQEDPFMAHFTHSLRPSLLAAISKPSPSLRTQNYSWPCLGNIQLIQAKSEPEADEAKPKLLDDEKFTDLRPLNNVPEEFDPEKFFIKSQIAKNIVQANRTFNLIDMSELQKELFTVACNYQDIYFPENTSASKEFVRLVYSAHALNHALKSKLKVLHHNSRLQKKSEVPEEFRDQGLVRPKVLILVPFRDSALRVVRMMKNILFEDDGNVMNKKRFYEEYGGYATLSDKYKNARPPDYGLIFSGNVDDNFKIGISVTKKCLKLYADFYTSDIIIASPVALRMLVGAEGEKTRDFDFLASIEVLILDQTEIFYMQNWEHVIHIMDHLHLQPKEAHGTDLARVRMWALNGWSKYYRQTMLFCSHQIPDVTALFLKKTHNYAGRVVVNNPVVTGSICQVISPTPQLFHFVNSTSVVNAIEERFEIFTKKILPEFQESCVKNILIYVPMYFDYVKIRNYFKRQDISFVQICEYSKKEKIARARDMFFHGQAKFLLYSERYHFFMRNRIRGVHHIIFYQLPAIPNFYSEMCNNMQDMQFRNPGQTDMSISVLYTKYDATFLSNIIGSSRTARMLASNKPTHMFMTDL